MRWLGVDVGTTHVKVVAFDDGMGVTATAIGATPVEHGPAGASRDPVKVADTVRLLVRQVITRAPRGVQVGGIAVASVGEEIVPLDRHGSPTGTVPTWFDPRGGEEARAFEPTRLHLRFPPDPTSSLFKLLWVATHCRPELDVAVRYLDLSAYVLARLGAAPVMDWSHASRTAAFDPVTVRWDPETLERARLPASAFPELVPSGTVVGRLDPEPALDLLLEPGTPLVAGGHDHFVGAYASGVRGAGEMFLSAGTSEAQLVLGGAPIAEADIEEPIDQGRFVDERHWYAHKAAPCGQLYGQWRDLLFRDDPGAIDAEVQAAPLAPGARVELDAGRHVASLLDLPTTATRGSVMRAVVEGSAVASSRVFRTLERATGGAVRRIVVAGHPAADPHWLSLRMGLIRRDVDVVSEAEVSALGAALLARRGVTGEPGPSARVSTRRLAAADIARGDEILARIGAVHDAPAMARAGFR